ncbi:MAG: cysteine desulfurase [Moraxellaceae bacterium]|nr:cysteine desulfurase [Pseudobdellovibrionaceae bacterium]
MPIESQKSIIYLDNNATTRPDPDLLAELVQLIQNDQFPWGNASSIHLQSRDPKNTLRETRRLFAEIFHCQATELIFNSGASEGNNTVLKSVWQSLGQSKNEFLISKVEHPSVIKAAEYIQSLGAVIKWIPVNRKGQIDLEFIKNNISNQTALVSVMFANNETGSLFPISTISEIIKPHGALLHVDCVQALGKEKLNLQELRIDYATFSGHKFYSLQGCGVLFVRRGSPLVNLIHGGGQERGRRGGTENILSVWSFQQMLPLLKWLEAKNHEVRKLRDHFEMNIQNKITGVTITAHEGLRLANTSSLVIQDVDGETLLMSLDLKGFAISTGAACSSGNPEPSPVLLSMGLSRDEAQSSLRVSLGWHTKPQEMDSFILALVEVVERIRKIKTEAEEKKSHAG